jgi:hypothetical protein
LPFVIASQIRRTFSIELFLSEACGLYIAFGGAALAGGLEYMYDRAAFTALGIVIAAVLLVLVFCDAYTNSKDRRSARLRFEVAIALAFGFVARSVAQAINSTWALPMWVMLIGTGVGLPMLFMVRELVRKPGPKAAVSGSSPTRLEELQQRAKKEYSKAWRTNWIWLIAAFIVIFITPKLRVQANGWELGSALFLIVIITLTFWRSKEGRIGSELHYRSLSISRDPYRNQIERKRDGLLFWAGGGVFGLLPGAGPTLILFLIAFPLFLIFVDWMAKAAYPSQISAVRLWIALVAFVILCLAWAFVRAANLRAARAMREELEALDRSEKDQ